MYRLQRRPTRRKANYRVLVIVLILLIVVFTVSYNPQRVSSDESNIGNESQSFAANSSSQIADILQQKLALTPAQQKIDWNLLQKLQQINEQYAALPADENLSLQNFSTSVFKINNEGMLEVKLTVSNVSDEQINQLKALGMNIQTILPEYGIVEGKLPYDAVETIASLDFVKQISTPGYPIYNTGAVTSVGDSVLKADLARSTFGINGSGSKIGVMSDGVDYLANSVASGDLPSGVQVLKAGSGDEGTAIMEIIHDLAPGASLAFYSPNTSSDMVVGIGALESAGCNIIVDDLTFPDEPKFEDGPIAQRAQQFVNSGGVYVTSAGNYRLEHYESAYNRGSFNHGEYIYAHNYGSGDMGNTFTIPSGGEITATLQWNNKWGSSPMDDFDFYLCDSTFNTVLAGSGNDQADGSYPNPFEDFFYYNNTSSTITVNLVVVEYSLVSAPSSIVLDYHVYGYTPTLQYSTTNDSIIGHAAVDEVLSTAAVAAATPNTLETYSSCGPGTIYFPSYQQRKVPNITGTDGVQTETGQLGYFYNPFYGTSAAAPHIAAIAALIWSANPTLNSSQVRHAITSTAVDLSTPGFDYYSGWGRANASAAVDSIFRPQLNISSSTGGTVTYPGIGTFGPYDPLQAVNITATANGCCHFVNWTGNISTIANVSNASTTITMNGSKTIQANFAYNGSSYLNISSGANGNVTTPGTGRKGPYNCSQIVNLSAVANSGYTFVSWSGNTTTIANVSAANTNITMNGDYSIRANFGLLPSGLYGDVNRNNKIDVSDYLAVKRMYLAELPLDASGDANGNGKIDVGDYLTVKRMYLTETPCVNKYEVLYNFSSGAGSNKWAKNSSISAPPPALNKTFETDTGWTNATTAQYNNISSTDGTVWNISGASGKYAALQCKFTIDSFICPAANITSIGVTLNGCAEANGDVLQFYAWNFSSNSWNQIGNNRSMTTDISTYAEWALGNKWGKVYTDYINGSGYMYILANLNNVSENLYVDYIKLTILHP